MDDQDIIALYLQRNEQAVKETESKYNSYCFRIANNIISIAEDAEECVNDTWKPVFGIIVATIVVCIAIVVCFMISSKVSASDRKMIQQSYASAYACAQENQVEIEKESAEVIRTEETIEVIFPVSNGEQQVRVTNTLKEGRIYCQSTVMEEKINLLATDVAELKEKYPEYFDLPTGKGLEIWVWQMGSNSYSFGVLSGTNRGTTNKELWSLRGVSADQMKAILSTYDIDEDEISIIPFQHPLSSYLGEYWAMQNGESQSSVAARQQTYIDSIREMLFGYE